MCVGGGSEHPQSWVPQTQERGREREGSTPHRLGIAGRGEEEGREVS